MPKDSFYPGDACPPASIQSFPVRSEKPVVGKLTGHWPFIVERKSMAMPEPVAGSLPLACQENSQFVT